MPIYDVRGDADELEIYDDLGADDFGSNYGDDYDTGADARQQRRRTVNNVVRLNAKDLPIGYAGAPLGSLAAAVGAVTTLTFDLNMLLRPDVLILENAVAPSVLVNDIKVGSISLNASANGACGDAFRHDTTSRLRGAVSGTPSVPVKVQLENKTSGAITSIGSCLKGPIKRVA